MPSFSDLRAGDWVEIEYQGDPDGAFFGAVLRGRIEMVLVDIGRAKACGFWFSDTDKILDYRKG